MPLYTFLSNNKDFIDKAQSIFTGDKFNFYLGKLEDYKPKMKLVYWSSGLNSLCFMDGGTDLAYSRKMFPGLELKVKSEVKSLNILSNLNRPYLPIGSSVIIETGIENNFFIGAPTMLLPQDINGTENVYYAMLAILNLVPNFTNDYELIILSLGCGYGRLTPEDSLIQITKAFIDYKINLNCHGKRKGKFYILNDEKINKQQPKTYQNREFIDFDIKELKNI